MYVKIFVCRTCTGGGTWPSVTEAACCPWGGSGATWWRTPGSPTPSSSPPPPLHTQYCIIYCSLLLLINCSQ